MSLITPDRTTGQERRFACKCGLRTMEPDVAGMHLIASFEERSRCQVVTERWTLGRWVFDRNISTEALRKMMKRGETQAEFAERINTALRKVTDLRDKLEADG